MPRKPLKPAAPPDDPLFTDLAAAEKDVERARRNERQALDRRDSIIRQLIGRKHTLSSIERRSNLSAQMIRCIRDNARSRKARSTL